MAENEKRPKGGDVRASERAGEGANKGAREGNTGGGRDRACPGRDSEAGRGLGVTRSSALLLAFLRPEKCSDPSGHAR